MERTIQDLNSALVESRGDGQPSGVKKLDNGGLSKDLVREQNHLEARIISLQSDLETANSHLAIEKERVSQNARRINMISNHLITFLR